MQKYDLIGTVVCARACACMCVCVYVRVCVWVFIMLSIAVKPCPVEMCRVLCVYGRVGMERFVIIHGLPQPTHSITITLSSTPQPIRTFHSSGMICSTLPLSKNSLTFVRLISPSFNSCPRRPLTTIFHSPSIKTRTPASIMLFFIFFDVEVLGEGAGCLRLLALFGGPDSTRVVVVVVPVNNNIHMHTHIRIHENVSNYYNHTTTHSHNTYHTTYRRCLSRF